MIDRGTLWAAALEDLGSRCSVDTTRDMEYVAERIAAEGESFLTTALPQFGKDFELALEEASISNAMFSGFGRRSRTIKIVDESKTVKLGGGVPKFLQGFVSLVFDDAYDVTSDEFRQMQYVVNQVQLSQSSEFGSRGTHNELVLHHMFPPREREIFEDNVGSISVIADAIAAVRQLCLMFGKEKSMCSDLNVNAAVEEFVRTDEELIIPFSTEE